MAPHVTETDAATVSLPATGPKKDHVSASAKTLDSPGSLSASMPNRAWIMGKEAFEKRMPHHDGIRALWETKWRFPCSKGLYPFHDGILADFEPVFTRLIDEGIDDGTSAAYTEAFLPAAEALVGQADAAVGRGELPEASALYLRACAVYRIARFPYLAGRPAVTDEAKWRAWEAQKAAYLRAGATWARPVEEVLVPHKCAAEGEGAEIPVYVRTPAGEGPAPTVLLLTGLDGYRPDNTVRCDEFLARGWASVVVEIPGTADCPAEAGDPAAAERLWDSLLGWMAADGRFDARKVMVWGLSAGGYYAVRMAHTHADRLVGSVAQGAGCHHFFDPEWLDRADGHEYPFRLGPALAAKHGYDSFEAYKAGAQAKFSLLENGILERKSCRLLLVNGVLDGLMPIEDSMLLFEHGSPKEARFFAGALHMGYPAANSAVYPWMESVMGQDGVGH